jgi:hypothetical protein
VGLSKEERVRWYELARFIPLSEAHANPIIKRLKDEGVNMMRFFEKQPGQSPRRRVRPKSIDRSYTIKGGQNLYRN